MKVNRTPFSSLMDFGTNVENLDVLGCQAAIYEWAESYDRKDWDRILKCIAPVLYMRLSSLRIQNIAL